MTSKKELPRTQVAVHVADPNQIEYDAFKMFMTMSNGHQRLAEFCFPNSDRPPVPQLGTSFDDSERETIKKVIRHFKDDFEEFEYNVVIVREPICGNFFYVGEDNFLIITTHTWERYFSPPSVFEYLFGYIACEVIAFQLNKSISHSWTAGSLFDFSYHKADARIGIVSSYLSDDVRQVLKMKSDHYLEAAQEMISQDWIGEIDDSTSLSHKLYKYHRYDIDRQSGFNKSFMQKFTDKGPDISLEMVRLVLESLIAVLFAGILFHLGWN